MSKRYASPFLAVLTLALAPATGWTADDLDELQEKAIKAAVRKVSPCVVQIETQGGTELVAAGPRRPGGSPGIRLGTGPTTGLIVHADGYVISSSFNFANKPSAIRVRVPGHKEAYVAEIVASDQTRMLTLLKLEGVSGKLPVPAAAPKSEMRIGQTALAVGRTLIGQVDQMPSVSVGILSALQRIWGKAVQTDAKVSPTNYGGPLIDLYGRVQGVLVPASPRSEGETAGFEWYDSGIGFAVPLEDINRVLPKMLKGTAKEVVTLRRGLLGVAMRQQQQGQDEHSTPAIIASVSPGSAAEKSGLKPGDAIKTMDGKPIDNQAQLRQVLGPKYDGDSVALKILRDKKEIELVVKLEGAIAAYPQSFLGILPMRDDPEPGVEVRFVYPGSPADKAGIKAGDRIMKIGREVPPAPLQLQAIAGRDQFLDMFQNAVPGLELSFEIKRGEGKKTETLKIKLAEVPETVPTKEQLPEKASVKKALTKPKGVGPQQPGAAKPEEKKPPAKKDDKKAEVGFLKRTTAAADHTYWLYVPDNYDPNIAHAVLVWLHPPGKNKEKDFDNFSQSWQFPCEDYHIILVCPKAESERGAWTQSEAEFVQEAVKAVGDSYTVDRRRIIAHGMDQGGEMAFYLGFRSRGLFHGVATTGSALAGNPRDKVANQPLSFFLAVGDKDPLRDAVKETKTKLTERKYPVIYREVKNLGRQYLDGRLGIDTLEELARWIDSLDRL